MKKIDYYEYRVPTWALCAMVNGDYSGLDESDINAIARFECDLDDIEQALPENQQLVGPDYPEDIDAEKGFYYRNDLTTLGDDCVDVKYWIMEETA